MNLQARLVDHHSVESFLATRSIFAPRNPSGLAPTKPSAARPVRERVSLGQGWRFSLGKSAYAHRLPVQDFPSVSGDHLSPLEDDASLMPVRGTRIEVLGQSLPWVQTIFDDRNWSHLSLSECSGTGWYRRTLTIGSGDAGKQIGLELNGGFRDALVWCNGHCLGRTGSVGLHRDLTPYLLKGGTNTLAVLLNEQAAFRSHRQPGPSAWLVKTNALHVAPWGTCVSAQTLGERAIKLTITTMLHNKHALGKRGMLVSRLLNATGEGLGEQSAPFHIFGDDHRSYEQRMTLLNVDCTSTPIHRIETSLIVEGRVIDACETDFDLRAIIANEWPDFQQSSG